MSRFKSVSTSSLLAFAVVLIGAFCGDARAEDAPAGKLLVTKAFYGDLPDGAKTDVTEKVADKVDDDHLSIEATNDNFGDPADGIAKKLKVEYTFDGKEQTKTVNENETLTISDKGE